MVHPWRSLSPTWPRLDAEQFMRPLASGTPLVSSAQPSLRKEKNLKSRDVQSHSCRCHGTALSQPTPIRVAGRWRTLRFFGLNTEFKQPLLTTSTLDWSSLHTACCCRNWTCHSQQLLLSKPGFNYKSVKGLPSPNNYSFSPTVILQRCSSTGYKAEKRNRIWPQLLTFCPLNKVIFDQESLFPPIHSVVLGDIFRTAQYLGSFTQDFLHSIFQNSPKVNQVLLIPRISSDPYTGIRTYPQIWHKTIREKKNSRPLSLAHQWILISIVMHLTCKSNGSLTQTFCAVTLQDVASYLDTTVFPTLPLLWMQRSAPKERGTRLESAQIQVTLNVTVPCCDCIG